MRPVALEARGFRGWTGRMELALDRPITALVAPNGRGKSSALNALEWCLFGDQICAKSTSGIDERAGWELRPRAGGAEPTEVRLVVRTEAGEATLTRRLEGAGKQSGRAFTLVLSDGTTLENGDATQWLAGVARADWETYRRAHCFHQEAARTRVLDLQDRNAILATLLGLGSDLALRDALAHKPDEIIRACDAARDELAGYIQTVQERPRAEMAAIEARLAGHGISRAQIGEGRALEERNALLRNAREWAGKLGLGAELPEVTDRHAVMEWARSWPATARGETPALAELPGLRDRRAALNAAVSQADAHEAAWKRAKMALDAEAGGGDLAARNGAIEEARLRVEAARDDLARANRRLTVLRDAKELIAPGLPATGTGARAASGPMTPPARLAAASQPDLFDTDRCPVCDTRVSGLLARLDSEIAALGTAETNALNARLIAAQHAERAACEARDAYTGLVASESGARNRRDVAREDLRRLLGDDVRDVHDVLAAARKAAERLGREAGDLESLANARDVALSEHEKGYERLKEVEAWLDACRRADAQVDVEALPQWHAFETALDEAAGFAADLEALAEMAREAQEERSSAREETVNASLGKYYRMIVGDDAAAGVRVRTKRTGQKVNYDLVDAEGRQAVPVLNQASINALSLALLFAQAEADARRGGLQCVVLDDPAQSLDDERQAGLARAVEELSGSCSVVMGLLPGPIVERLRRYVSVPRRFVTLAPWDADRGARVEEVEDL